MASSKKDRSLDFKNFPPGTVTEYTTLVCLACIFDIFTTQLGLAPRTAYSEIKKYSPTVDELTAPKAVRPFFDSDEMHPHCPYCSAAKRWHARLDTFGIEGTKSADSARRELVKSLPKKDEQFRLLEMKSDRRKVFFSWLDTLELKLDQEEEIWLQGAARAYLERIEPKTDWSEVFEGVRAVRRSNRLQQGWERDGSRLFLAPELWNEVLVVQYLLSRSHAHGGRTFEGRLTLTELIRRLRYSGYLQSRAISEGDQFEILEGVIDSLAGGTGSVKVYYVVDRRNFLEKVKSVYARYAS
jgi:hypothetical protein